MIRNCFPFSAVLGCKDIKEALILNSVNPNIGGLLISGEKGTAKSTLVRGISRVTKDIDIIELPLNITEDRLVGSIDIELAISKGEKSLSYGILKKAHNNILYVDEVNLLSEHIVNCLLEVSASKVNIVEREGITAKHDSDFVLIGSMNPEEGLLRPSLLDRFSLYVEAKGEKNLKNRIEIIKRRLEYEKNPKEFILKWDKENKKIGKKINEAKDKLSIVQVTHENMLYAAELSQTAFCQGHRAEIIMIETAKAIAALNNSHIIMKEDIDKAAKYVLPHRIKEPLEANRNEPQSSDSNNNQDEKRNEEKNANENKPDLQNEVENMSQSSNNINKDFKNDSNNLNNSEEEPKDSNKFEENDTIEQPKNPNKTINLEIEAKKKKKSNGNGKRKKVETNTNKGRYIRYQVPHGKITDIAFDATIRAAAPYQRYRISEAVNLTDSPTSPQSEKMKLVVKKSDIKEKVREKHTGCVIMFVVDASGSMGAKRRMQVVKGTIISLLNDAYQKRDRVGMIAFRKEKAELLLGITRSVDLAQKKLKDLPTGGKTPLAHSLDKAYEVLKAYKTKEPNMIFHLVLVSDGRANVPTRSNNPVDDSLKAAERIKNEGISCMVLDTESGYIQLNLAKKIAEAMDAKYIKIEDVNKNVVKQQIKNLVAI